MGGLADYAKDELQRAGLFDEDSDYGGMLGKAALKLVELFAEQGHSGCSAAITTHIVTRLMRYRPLTSIQQPVEGDYNEVGHYEPRNKILTGHAILQHRRLSSLFSNDGGKSWYDIDAPKRIRYKPWTWRRTRFVRFPYMPT